MLSTRTAEVHVEEASDGEKRVYAEGTMYHTGLNANAWGLTEAGADAVAETLVGQDYTAAHPFLRGHRYDRSIAEGQGAPIGEVLSTEVVSVGSATLMGGEYTASFRAEVLDPTFKERMATGLLTAAGYGVSIGIYADPETAVCSVCHNEMAGDDCEHRRGEEVRIESDDGDVETQVAGPLYPDGDADHLAHVYIPAYEGADDTQVTTTDAAAADDGGIAAYSAKSHVPEAASVLAEPFDPEPTTAHAATTEPAESSREATDDGYRVRVTAPRQLPTQRGPYHVQLTND